MTEKNKNKINNPELYIDFNIMNDFLKNYVICRKLDVYYRGTLQSEEALIPNAVKNRRKLKILEGCLDRVVSNQDSKFIDSVYSFIDLKLKLFTLLDKVPIAIIFLNRAKTKANEEKKNLEVQFGAKEEIVYANTKVGSKQKEKEKIVENIKTNNGTEYSDFNKTESYPKRNIKGIKEVEKHNKSEIYIDKSQSTKQGSSNISIDVNVIDGIKLIFDKYINNSLPNTVEEKLTITMEKVSPKLKNAKSSKELQNHIKEFLKSYNIKLNNISNNHEGDKMASKIIQTGKRDVLLESIKRSNKTTNPSTEEKNYIKSEVSNQDRQILLKYINSKINGYELKRSSLETFFKSFKKFERIFSFSEYYSSSEEVKDETVKRMDKHTHDINKIIDDLHYVNDAENIIKDAIRLTFLVQTTTFSQNVFTNDIQKVQKVSSFAVRKTSDKSTSDETFEFYSKTGKNNDEADELVKRFNKNIGFKIDTDGKMIFTLGGQDFNASESKQVVFNCKEGKVKISFIDSQIFVSTENSEFHISIRKPKSVDIQDDCTQTETTQ